MEIDVTLATNEDSGSRAGTGTLAREEVMLTHKLRLLEDFVKLNENLPDVSERCQILKNRIASIESQISLAGKLGLSRRYLQDSVPQIQQEDFQKWLDDSNDTTDPTSSSKTASQLATYNKHSKSTPSPGHAENVRDKLVDSPTHIDDHGHGNQSSSRKRPRIGPRSCLRCRLFKHQCDSLERCRGCPEKSDEDENNFWKVFGCFRGHLRELSSIFLPSPLHTIERNLTKQTGLSAIKRDLIQAIDLGNDIVKLEDNLWSERQLRPAIFRKDYNPQLLPSPSHTSLAPIELQDLELPWRLLQLASYNESYSGITIYNPITLIRVGNELSRSNPSSWEVFLQSKRLLCGAIEVYLAEAAISEADNSDRINLADLPPKAFTIVDIEDELQSFLELFETATLSRRNWLDSEKQLACLYALCMFSMVKSILIDSCSLRRSYGEQGTWKDTDAIRINSCYKVLVSMFNQSSRLDFLFVKSQDTDRLQSSVEITKQLLHVAQWVQWGFNRPREALFAMGSVMVSNPNPIFHGFFVQRFGINRLPLINMSKVDIDEIRGQAPETREQGHRSETFADFLNPINTTTALPAQDPDDAPELTEPLGRLKTGQVYTFVRPESPGLFSMALEIRSTTDSTSQGIRSGPLDPEIRAKAHQIRALKACWPCWIQKIPCSHGDPCQSCAKRMNELSCTRVSLKDYTPLFNTSALAYHLSLENISTYTSSQILEWTDQVLEIEISLDGLSITRLSASIFVPKSGLRRRFKRLYLNKIVELHSVEIAIPLAESISMPKLLEANFQYVRAQNLSVANQSGMSLQEKVLKLLFEFSMNPESKLLTSALGLFLIIRSMSQALTFTGNSASITTGIFQSTSLPLTSNILEVQLKQKIQKIYRQNLIDLLDELERTLRRRTFDYCPILIATILALCICIEEIQIAAIASNFKSPLIGEELMSREATVAACKSLDDIPFKTIYYLFHTIYKGVFEAAEKLQGGFQADPTAGNAIRELQLLMKSSDSELMELDQVPNYEIPSGESGLEEFCRRNRGRLIAKFLLGFQFPGAQTSSNSGTSSSQGAATIQNFTPVQLSSRNLCEICNKTFTRVSDLKRHQTESHRPGIRFSCPYCEKYQGESGFKRKERLRLHIRNYHGISDARLWGE